MNKVLLSALALLFSIQSFGQITLGTADFPHVNDIDTVSTATAFFGMDYQSTGTNYVWDFANLDSTTTGMRIDTFVSVASTGSFFSLYFGFLNPANHAGKGADLNIGPVSLTGVYNFYNNTAANYRQCGFGATIAGLPITLPINTIPIGYTPSDIIYKFPMNYGNVDSCAPVDTLGVPGLLYFKGAKTRHNEVDGWGKVTTPYGTFDCLRIKSIVNEHDSIHIDTLGIGFGFDQPERIEYKWLGHGKGEPLLQVVTTGGIISEIFYRGFPVCNLVSAYSTPQDTVNDGTTLNFTNATNLSSTFEWKIDGTTFSTSKDASYTFSTPGTYTVTMIATHLSCVDSTSRVITVFYTTCSLATVFTASNETIYKGQNVTLSGSSSAPVSYAWTMDDSLFSTAKDTLYNFPHAGSYKVTLVTNHLNCTDSVSRYITVLPHDFALDIYPNPVVSDLTIFCALPEQSDVRIEMIDVLGQTLSTDEWIGLPAGEHHLFLSIPPALHASSAYFLRIKWKNGEFVKNLLVTRE